MSAPAGAPMRPLVTGGTAEEPTPELEPSAVPDTVRIYFPETWLFDLHTVKSVRSSCADNSLTHVYTYDRTR